MVFVGVDRGAVSVAQAGTAPGMCVLRRVLSPQQDCNGAVDIRPGAHVVRLDSAPMRAVYGSCVLDHYTDGIDPIRVRNLHEAFSRLFRGRDRVKA